MNNLPSPVSHASLAARLAHMRPMLCRVVPAAAVLAFLAWCLITLRPDFSCDDLEPEVLNQAWRLARGESIYHGINTPPFSFAAYPPLWFALVGLLLKVTGLSYLPAKLVSFLSALSIGLAMASLSRRWHGTARNGVWAAFFLFLIPAFLFNAARSNVQMMAVALSLWSLVFFLRDRWPETLIISPLLAVLAFYTKQSQVALPLAMVAFLALRKRRWLPAYLTTAAAAGIIPLLWLQAVSGGNFLYDTVQLANLSYTVLQIVPIFLHHAGPLLIFIVLAVLTSWQRLREGRWEPIDFYLACLLATTVMSLGRIGAHGQYVVELLVVTMLYLLRISGPFLLPGKDVLVSLQVLFLLVYAPLFIFIEEGLHNVACNRAAARIYPLIEKGSGPILSQQGSFALFGRGEIYIQLFHFTALTRAGVWDQEILLNQIERRAFSWVITEFPIGGSDLSADDRERFTPEMISALRRNYRLQVPIYPYYLYRPLVETGL